MAAVESRAFIAWDGDFWAVGRYGSPAITTSIAVRETTAYASWGRAVITQAGEGDLVFTIVDPAAGSSRTIRAEAAPGAVARSWATTDPLGETLYFHYSIEGFDGGLHSIDVATGAVEQLTQPTRLDEGVARSWMHWSPSGNSLASMVCDSTTCAVDLLDVTAGRSVRRLSTPFVAWAITDRFMVGSDQKSDSSINDWAILDIAAGTVRPLPDGLIIQPNAIMPLADDRFLVDTGQVGQGRHDVVRVDGAGSDHRVLLDESLSVSSLVAIADNQFNPVPGLMLLARGNGPGLIMIEVVANGTPALSVLTADGQLYESAIPVVR